MRAMSSQQTHAPVLRCRRNLLLAGLAACLPCSAETPAHEWRAWPRAQVVPPLELDRLDGTRWRLRDQRGSVLLVNFWASWCEPCRDEMPSLMRLAERMRGDRLQVVAVNFRETPATVRLFVDAQGDAARNWTPRAFPSTVLIDRRGRPAGLWVGEVDWDSAEPLDRAGDRLSAFARERVERQCARGARGDRLALRRTNGARRVRRRQRADLVGDQPGRDAQSRHRFQPQREHRYGQGATPVRLGCRQHLSRAQGARLRVGDIKAMLETRNFGGKCGDINGLFVGLARAAGVPAR
jgi:thiol-disulfide isomerase/thioredoxin